MYLITGGAGFIGSNIAAALDAVNEEIVIVDTLGSDDLKWRNIAKRRVVDIVRPEACAAFLAARRNEIRGILHMGAISTTTETDVDAIVRNNIRLSIDLWTFASRAQIPLVYASSAATYGSGENGFLDDDDETYLARLRPLNPYGWSKNVFDRFVSDQVKRGAPSPPRWAGLKFFNVYGPNEYHKGNQRSVAAQLHEQIRTQGFVRLFRSDNPAYVDGEQLRDFVWVDDCVSVALWVLRTESVRSGLYNVGSGMARSFLDKARIIFAAMGLKERIEFIDLPINVRGKYQYYTCASLKKLRNSGFTHAMTTLEDGLSIFVRDYLEAADRFR
jgi:ADP-L-glycero-D-manno-heptose 6-epimerase